MSARLVKCLQRRDLAVLASMAASESLPVIKFQPTIAIELSAN